MKRRIISVTIAVIIAISSSSCYVIVRDKHHPRHPHANSQPIDNNDGRSSVAPFNGDKLGDNAQENYRE